VLTTTPLVEDPKQGMRHRFVAEGDVTIVETWVDPGGGVPAHIHPVTEEAFEVVEGEAQFLSGRRWITCGPGEGAVIAPGTRHAFRNRSRAEAHIRCRATPGMSLERFLTDAAAMGRAGLLGPLSLPKGWDALLQAAVLVDDHKDMVTMLFPPLPPPALQRLVMPRLARAGRRRGYGPGRLGDQA
jgi:quercetin dioxygenase-like cupin family protein